MSTQSSIAAPVELLDCSDRIRIGLKGPRAIEWLRRQGCDVPAASNTWCTIADESDSVVARLGQSEFLLDQARPGTLIQALAEKLSQPLEGVYPVLREDRSFQLRGNAVHDVLAQVCNVDFKSVSRSQRHLVMTMMIGIAVVVIPLDGIRGQSPNAQNNDVSASNAAREANGGCYRIWCDPSYGDYLWSSLQDVIRDA